MSHTRGILENWGTCSININYSLQRNKYFWPEFFVFQLSKKLLTESDDFHNPLGLTLLNTPETEQTQKLSAILIFPKEVVRSIVSNWWYNYTPRGKQQVSIFKFFRDLDLVTVTDYHIRQEQLLFVSVNVSH